MTESKRWELISFLADSIVYLSQMHVLMVESNEDQGEIDEVYQTIRKNSDTLNLLVKKNN